MHLPGDEVGCIHNSKSAASTFHRLLQLYHAQSTLLSQSLKFHDSKYVEPDHSHPDPQKAGYHGITTLPSISKIFEHPQNQEYAMNGVNIDSSESSLPISNTAFQLSPTASSSSAIEVVKKTQTSGLKYQYADVLVGKNCSPKPYNQSSLKKAANYKPMSLDPDHRTTCLDTSQCSPQICAYQGALNKSLLLPPMQLPDPRSSVLSIPSHSCQYSSGIEQKLVENKRSYSDLHELVTATDSIAHLPSHAATYVERCGLCFTSETVHSVLRRRIN